MASVVVTVLLVGTLPLSFLRPWVGVLIFLFVCFATPQRYVSGFAYDLPFARLIAAAVLFGLVRHRDWYPPPRLRELYLIGGLLMVFLLSTCLTATHPERAWNSLLRASKILLMAGVSLMLFTERRQLRPLLLVVVLSIGLYGMGGGLWVLWTGGQHALYGPKGTFLADNNLLAFALVTILPLLVFLRRTESKPWVRRGFLILFALSILAVLGTYSRGSLINLFLVLLCIVMAIRSGDRAIWAVVAAVPVVIWLAPPRYHERVETVAAPLEDRSGLMRLKSAYVALRLGLDHPVLGAGFRPFDEAVYERYLPGYRDDHNAHNHFLQIFAEHGVPGLLLYTALIVSLLLRLVRAIGRTRGDPRRSAVHNYSIGLLISLGAYVVGGMFINQPYFEPFYQLAAAIVLVSRLADSADTPS